MMLNFKHWKEKIKKSATRSTQVAKAKGGEVFIQSLQDLKGLKKGRKVIVYGAATIANFLPNTPKAQSESHEETKGYYQQPVRFPNDSLTSIVSKKSDALQVQVNADLIDACADAGIDIAGVGVDGVANYGLKQSARSKKHIILLVVHRDAAESRYIVEEWVFFKRRLISVQESLISIDEFADPIGNLASQIADVMDSYDPTAVEYLITGNHSFTEADVYDLFSILSREVNQQYSFVAAPSDAYFNDSNAQYGNVIFVPFRTLSFVGPKVGKGDRVKNFYQVPVAILLLGCASYYLFYQSGVSQYDAAIKEHRREASLIQDIYEKGGAAINLVESREYYMEDLKEQRSPFSRTIRQILVSLTNLSQEMPGAEPRLERLVYGGDGLNEYSDADFELVITFNAQGIRDSLSISNDIHTFLSSDLNANTRSNDAPRREGAATLGRYRLTIVGDLHE